MEPVLDTGVSRVANDSQARLNVGTITASVIAGFTRPADTNAYTAKDVVGPSTTALASRPMMFENCARDPGGTGVLLSALLFDSVDATPRANFDLILFDNPYFTLAADNAVGTVTDSEVLSVVAVVTFDGTNAGNVATAGPNLIIGASSIGQAFKCAANTKNLWGMVVDRGGYTPASAETFNFKLLIQQD